MAGVRRVGRDDESTEEFAGETPAPTGGVAGSLLRPGERFGEGRYALERSLGYGGMAAVWLARDERLARPVAIKILSETLAGERDYLARFEREAQVAAGLAHPNLVSIYDYGTERGRQYLVMEYVPGGDLAARLEAGGAADPERLARELLSALRHIHEAGVIHRDVKPQNVLLGDEERALLTDFGIAQPRDATSLTETGLVLGTARYLAPEVMAGEPPDERSDLYSLGVVLKEATDARPAGSELGALVAALHAEDPDARPASAAAAIDMLDRPAPARLEPTAPIAVAPAGEAEAPAAGRSWRAPRLPALGTGAAGALLAGLLVSVLAIVILAGGNDGSREGELQEAEQAAVEGGEGEQAAEGANGGGEERGDGAGSEAQPVASVEDGARLNDRGFQLINDGRPEQAVPVLRRAVDALEGSGEITYAYALFNLGHALRLAGRPEQAIPILEQRLEIPDQRDTVRRELEAARAAAGQGDDGGDDRGESEPRGRARGHDDD